MTFRNARAMSVEWGQEKCSEKKMFCRTNCDFCSRKRGCTSAVEWATCLSEGSWLRSERALRVGSIPFWARRESRSGQNTTRTLLRRDMVSSSKGLELDHN